MIIIIAKNEKGWLDEKTDFFQWEHLAVHAYKVDKVHLVHSISEVIDEYPNLKRVFLEPPANTNLIENSLLELKDYDHPKNCIYIFGNSSSNNIRLIRPQDDIVTIHTPNPKATAIFGVCIAAIVLYDRERKKQ